MKATIEEAQGRPSRRSRLSRRPTRCAPAIVMRRKVCSGSARYRPARRTKADAGVGTWQVVERGSRYLAVNDQYPRLAIPLEMMGSGAPKLLAWDLKEDPYRGIGLLRFQAGAISSKRGQEELESVAVVDVDMGVVIAIEPHRQGDKIATWTWDGNKVTVATADGVTDDFELRVARPAYATTGQGGGGGRYTTGTTQTGGSRGRYGIRRWCGSFSQEPTKRVQVKKKKPKTIFDLLFN